MKLRMCVVAGVLVALALVLSNGSRLSPPIGADADAIENAVTSSAALTGTWVRTGGPLGGLGYDIRMQPDNPDIMYVTDAYAGVHKSTDGGKTWVVSDAGIDARTGPSNDAIPVFCLTIDPNNYNTLWIGMTEIRGVYRSTDAGATWVKKDTGIIENAGLTIRGIGVKPGDSNTVFAAGEVSSFIWNGGTEARGREFDRVQGVIYRSTNAGQSWTEVWRGDNLARYVLFDPTNPNTVYASTGLFDREAKNSNPTTGAPGGVGVLKSTDGGSTWTALASGLGNLYVNSLFISPTNPQILLAATANNAYRAGGGVYRTTNGGASWQPVIQSGAGESGIQAVEYSTTASTVAYAVGADPSKFYKSTDSGATWTLVNPTTKWGPAGIRPGFPIDVQADPRNAQRLFVNNYGGGNFLSTDGGVTWTSASTGYTGADLTDVVVDPTSGGRMYATGRSGPFKSTDAGGTWTGINPVSGQEIAEGARVAVDPSNPNTVVMSSAHGGWTYRSTNGGTSWTLVTNFADELNALPVSDTNQRFQGMQALAFAPSDPSRAYGGFGVWRCATDVNASLCNASTIASIFTSIDGGATWTRRNGVLGNRTVSRIVVDPQNASKAWASTLGGGVFITADGGNTWTASNTGLTDLKVWSLAGTPGNASVLYAGTFSSGIFKSTDGGASWTAASAGMSANEPISSLVVSAVESNVVYAGSRSTGVYVSTNAGASWTLDSNGLRQRTVNALSLSADGKVLYAATKGGGVYRLGTPPPAEICTYSISPTTKSLTSAGGNATVAVTAGAGCSWTAASNATWLTLSTGASGAGSGNATYTASANTSPSFRTGTLTIAGQTHTVTQGATMTAVPFGNVDTPAQGATNVTGSIAVTGWALDDLQVTRVRLFRDPVAGEPPGNAIFVGDAVQVTGARPDIAASYPTTPFKDLAGWGYLLLTNMLPGKGNGTFTLRILADDLEGNSIQLGARTITCTNATAVKPFGGIDTPGQGETISGAAYVNFGWTLTPLPKAIAIDGSTITVYIDGVAVGTVTYNNFRSDIAALFPGLANTPGAIGFRVINTTTITDGVHTIQWVVTDNAGSAEGIGSRYFNVLNGSGVHGASLSTQRATAPRVSHRGIWGRHGLDATAPAERLEPDRNGTIWMQQPALDRLELHLAPPSVKACATQYAGHQILDGRAVALPIGSTLDPRRGVFYWQPGVGFLGTFHLVFVETDCGGASQHIAVNVVLQPRN